ncbi:MAG: hypothetical protein GXP30_12420 [Verrucomicrobia bacterium]|nr:hypothetical protein [Verrucomicrobiota bacterium]
MKLIRKLRIYTLLMLAPAALMFILGGCVNLANTGSPAASPFEQSKSNPLATLSDSASMARLDYKPLQAGRTKKWRFDKKDPQILAEGSRTHFQTFKLPTAQFPLTLKVETSTSFEIPNYPVKYLFCPRVLLLDKNFKVVFSSDLDDLRKRQRLLGEPRFIFEYPLSSKTTARYLLVIRERDFDGDYVNSIQPVDAPIYDDLLRRERERIFASPTGPVRVSLK